MSAPISSVKERFLGEEGGIIKNHMSKVSSTNLQYQTELEHQMEYCDNNTIHDLSFMRNIACPLTVLGKTTPNTLKKRVSIG